MKLLLGLIPLLFFIGFASADALESNQDFVIISDNIILTISIDSDGKETLIDALLNIDQINYSLNPEKKLVERFSLEGDKGRIYGSLNTDGKFYIIYDLSKDTILVKVWQNGEKSRLIESITDVKTLF